MIKGDIINNNNNVAVTLESHELPNRFYINEFFVDNDTGEITFGDEVHVVEPKVMAILKVLAKSPKQVFSAEALFELVWPQAIFSPNSVRRNISLLRQVLRDDDKTIIKTHPKRGYSLEADVKVLNETPKKHLNPNSYLGLSKRWLSVAVLSVILISLLVLFFPTSNPELNLSNLQPVTSSNEEERYMQVSPDGRFMAYIQNTDWPNKRILLMKDLVTESHWPLVETSKAYTYLTWNADNGSLIYSLNDGESISFGRLFLDKRAKVVSDETLFTRRDITWNSWFFIDKHQNLYYLANKNASEHSRNVSLYKYNLVTGSSEVVTKPNDKFKLYRIAMSPDQSQLALVGFNEQGISEVKLLNLASNNIESIVAIDHNWHFLTWFESGDSLLLSNGSALSRLELNGVLTRLSFKSYNFLVYPQIVKDTLYFIEAKSDQDILISSLDPFSQPYKIVDSNTVDKDASLSPDAKSLAFLTMKNGLPQLVVKEIETGNERLVFANKEQEYALSQPIWDKSNKRIVSSINNKPFIIHLEEGSFSIEWLNNILGVPKAWYTQADAILFIDKRNHKDELVKLTLKNAKVTALNIQPHRKTFFLDNNDRLVFVDNGLVLTMYSDKPLLPSSLKVSFVYPNVRGFYYRYKQENQSRIGFYDYLNGTKELSSDFDEFCQLYCEQITTIRGNIILLNEYRNTADILKLNIIKN